VRDPRIKVQHRRPVDDKFIRAAKVLPWFEAGITLVSVPGSNAWVEPYLNEFMCFPNGTNDDQVDSLVQLLHLRWVVCLLGRR
jgi:predicted phage terminase large subunit-like protein